MTESPAARVAEQAQALADVIRYALRPIGPRRGADTKALAALDGLLAVVATAERVLSKPTTKAWFDACLAAEARVATLQQERDEAVGAKEGWRILFAKAEAELVAVREHETRLREALEDLLGQEFDAGVDYVEDGAIARARAALVVSSPPPGAPKPQETRMAAPTRRTSSTAGSIRVTGRLLQGDRVNTPDGPGTITASYLAVHMVNPAAYHIVELDTGERRPYRNDQVVFVARQLAIDPNNP